MRIIQGDISEETADAVAASAFGDLRRRCGEESAVYRRGGAELRALRAAVGRIDTGAAVATAAGGALRCRTVVHAVPPQWHGGGEGAVDALRRCYRESLEAARGAGCQTVAFPLLGVGSHGVPLEASLRTALDELEAEEDRGGMSCTLVLQADEAMSAALTMFLEVGQFLLAEEEEYEDDDRESSERLFSCMRFQIDDFGIGEGLVYGDGGGMFQTDEGVWPFSLDEELKKRVDNVGPGVGKALMALMNQKHFDNQKLMARTGISKQLLSKIQNGKHAKAPEKRWLLAVSVAMGLTLGETREFLATAGYALSKSSKVDLVVEFYLAKGNARIGEVDTALACYGLPTLFPPDAKGKKNGEGNP